MPFIIGSTTPSTALAAIAASAAEPPLRQDLRAGLGCERMAGGRDALLRDHHRPAVVAPERRLYA